MKKYLIPIMAATAALGWGGIAPAASLSLNVTVNDPASTAISCVPGTLTAPVAAGTSICTVAVSPTGVWLMPPGTLTLSGPNAADFAVASTPGSNSTLVVAPGVTLQASGYAVTITATP